MERLEQISYLNSLRGQLNKRDGIECIDCRNKGIIYVDLGEDAVIGVADCQSCVNERLEYAQEHNLRIRVMNKKNVKQYTYSNNKKKPSRNGNSSKGRR